MVRISIIHLSLLLPLFALSRGDEFTFCVDVYQQFADCMEFLEGLAPEPPRACCDNLPTLNDLAKQNQVGPELLCRCIEDIAHVLDTPYVTSRIDDLLGKCQVHLSFPISNAMNCSMVESWGMTRQAKMMG
ncbi:hypothetical protein BT93_A1613 [Corymbia citriodora subsp. variegata]|nr:hypothetical protein BT93_A1613 [Corymbia citriodora subsp. variegata]